MANTMRSMIKELTAQTYMKLCGLCKGSGNLCCFGQLKLVEYFKCNACEGRGVRDLNV